VNHRDDARSPSALQRVERTRTPRREYSLPQHGEEQDCEEEDREEDAEVDGREDSGGYTRLA
jgi:hypothetical protein